MEKANERQVPLHFSFVNFNAAFDTVLRGALWTMCIAVDPKIISMIEYDNVKYAFVINGQLTEWLRVEIRVR